MKIKKYRALLEVFFLSIFVYVGHKLFFYYQRNNPIYQNFHYPIEVVYAFFSSFSIVLLYILIIVKAKNIDQVGNTFMLITVLKMGISYVILSPILDSGLANMPIEKINFFIVFALFLAIETAVSIRILNNNQ